ncbi:pyridine nucleotide-disulfide oxidoreductase [Streptobacillus moniliformis]|uniref:Pyridine nucleotide-disulphide oxidoreductase dimerization region n=1 Tax=Streptobacillus moniliformis (strain ATCC 14647 / DSM 12112 / NCTC 10651 / 9901) TaxID=519441 RepID=D1AYU3_STRM9|nr:FAD-dependent oxidoreductase [Streptobacillus moniliformis]ACZ01469.1 pyridine nucleotide-disulphide oxidoreductase dimerization region [Streptobacillus moniliformis DSM 12112]AVL43525.1 pyridine nucleotide-disulfide oxidoreductase [Streptobacillus moniliformis]SQA13370.1 NADH peroxidase [Streptobacillus moniliformis]
MRIVVIGGGAAGMMFSTQYKKMNPNDEIILFEKTPYVSWAGCPSPYYIANELPLKKVIGSPSDSFINKGIDVRINTKVSEINFDEKHVIVNNEKVTYDKLVLAIGAKSTLDIKKDRYFSLSHATDAIEIKNFIENKKPKKALILGLGFIGLEMVEALLLNNINVTVVEKANDVFNILPLEYRNILKEKIKNKNVELILGNGVKEFNEENVILENNEKIDFDMLIISTGITTKTEILGDKIELLNNKIIVDNNFKTNIEDVYAIGDAILNKNIITNEYTYAPFGDVANKHGMMLAKLLSSKKSEFIGVTNTYATSFFDLKIAGTGLTEDVAISKGYNVGKVNMEVLTKNSGFKDSVPGSAEIIYDKDTNTVLGATIIGNEAVAQFIDQIAIVIRFRIKIDDLISVDFAYSPTNASVWNPLLVLYRKVIK